MKLSSLPWSLQAVVFAAVANADSFPYNPTKVLSNTNSTHAYILQPSLQSPNQGLLTAISIVDGFSTSQLSPTTITDSLPFLKDDSLIPYTPIMDAFGNITVVAGTCTAGADGTEIWRFWPKSNDKSGTGTWIQYQTSDQDLAPGSNLTGSNYLANGVAFSPQVDNINSELGFYLFGGMCPFSDGDASTWVADAAYSNAMLQLLPGASKSGDTIYDIQLVASTGPAIAEAGFSLTGLPPTFSVNSSGQIHSQQQDFLLIGGHTQGAFINMSNIALFSLPQETWTFQPIQQPTSVQTELAARQEQSMVEPRSGHTAVLSPDGASVVVFGGWVGDVSNPAQPQLAVLHLGSEYGGDESNEWTWSVPASSAGPSPSGDGIYGHGATMLPGGVMMVVGGYSISSSSSDQTKRDVQTTNNNIYLYNITSSTWIDTYTPPAEVSAATDSRPAGALSKTSQQAGLGVGLGVGALALAGLCCFSLWYSRRLRKRREAREQALLADPSQVSFMQLDHSYMDRPGIDGRGGDIYAGQVPVGEMTQAGSTGLFMNVPSPTRGLRTGLAKRPYMYHAAPRYDERRMNHGSGNIHPILESEDEHSIRGDDDQVDESKAVQKLRNVAGVFHSKPKEPEQSLSDLQRILKSRSPSPVKDPFADPEPNPLGSHPVSPIVADTVRRVPTGASRMNSTARRPASTEMDGSTNWMVIAAPDDPFEQSSSSNGRSSPSRTDDRTSSTLSEASQRSHASSNSITRTMSTRTGALLSAALAQRRQAEDQETNPFSNVEERTSTMGTSSSGTRSMHSSDAPYNNSPYRARTREPTNVAKKSADSFATARSSFAALQSEGQVLLGGRPAVDRDDPYQRALAATKLQREGVHTSKETDSTPIVSPRRNKGWMGSLRRALTAMSNSERSFSFTGSVLERFEDEPRTTSSSPTRPQRPLISTATPRRAASDGGALLRQKRGENDWQKDKDFTPYRDDPDPGDWGERRTSSDDRAAENEWDVEGAVSKRDVQVMFTVPKARLRVVNADVERASMRSVSDSAMSRSESVRNLKRQESVNTVRSRTDAERTGDRGAHLASTAEEADEAKSTARDL